MLVALGLAVGCWVAAAATREPADLHLPERQAGHDAGLPGQCTVSRLVVEYGQAGDVAGACSVESATTGSEVRVPEPADIGASCKGLMLDEEMAASPTRFAEDAEAGPPNRVASSRRKLF